MVQGKRLIPKLSLNSPLENKQVKNTSNFWKKIRQHKHQISSMYLKITLFLKNCKVHLISQKAIHLNKNLKENFRENTQDHF